MNYLNGPVLDCHSMRERILWIEISRTRIHNKLERLV